MWSPLEFKYGICITYFPNYFYGKRCGLQGVPVAKCTKMSLDPIAIGL